MAHRVEPLLPFDIMLTTFLVPNLTKPLSTANLIVTCAHQLKLHNDDLIAIRDNILKSHLASARRFECQYENTLLAYDFKPGDLVLIRNSSTESDLRRKTKLQYIGPLVVLRRTHNGVYRLAELDSTVSKLRYAAFCLVPYFSRSQTSIPVTHILDHDDLTELVNDIADDNT